MSDFWTETVTGERVDFVDTDPDSIHMFDIWYQLSRINRYTGATNWDVCSHSVLTASLVDEKIFIPLALFHDAAEAYLGDVSAPLKRLIGFDGNPSYMELEQRFENMIWKRFELHVDSAALMAVKRADMEAVVHERAAFLPMTGRHEWLAKKSDNVSLAVENCKKCKPLGKTYVWLHVVGALPAHVVRRELEYAELAMQRLAGMYLSPSATELMRHLTVFIDKCTTSLEVLDVAKRVEEARIVCDRGASEVPGDAGEDFRKRLSQWLDKRLEAVLSAPTMWGSDEAVEMQALLLFELQAFARQPGGVEAAPSAVLDAYAEFLRMKFPGRPRAPLSELAPEQFSAWLREFREVLLESFPVRGRATSASR